MWKEFNILKDSFIHKAAIILHKAKLDKTII
jgi:hypothetical protein